MLQGVMKSVQEELKQFKEEQAALQGEVEKKKSECTRLAVGVGWGDNA